MVTMPLFAQFEITEVCNFRCPHCYRLDDTTVRHHVDSEKIHFLLDRLLAAGLMSIVITGGEPFSRKGLLLELIKKVVSNNVHCSVNTNLSLISPSFFNQLLVVKPDNILISCPSSNPEIYRQMTGGGSLNRFWQVLPLIVASPIKFTVNMVVNKLNIYNIQETARALVSNGVRSFAATPMAYNHDNPLRHLFLDRKEVMFLTDQLVTIHEDLGIYVDILESLPKCAFSERAIQSGLPFLRRRCQAGRTVISVSPNGDVRPCAHSPIAYGNLFSTSIEEIWDNMAEWRTKKYFPSKCKECKMLQRCFSGCRINAKVATGEDNGMDPWADSPIEMFSTHHFENIIVNDDTVIDKSNNFRWRKEIDGTYTVCTNSPNNATRITQELFKMLNLLMPILPASFEQIIGKLDLLESKEEVKSLLQDLLRRDILVNVKAGRG